MTQPHAAATAARARGAVIGVVVVVLLLLAAAAFVTWFFYCPCERTPGGYLLGQVVEETVTDWSFANEVPLCQIQVATRPLPHSINLNCMATADGELYLSCSSCDGKRWSDAVRADPGARLRLDDRVYPVSVTRVTAAAEMDRSWTARITKLNELWGDRAPPLDTPRPPDDAWWTFRVESASG